MSTYVSTPVSLWQRLSVEVVDKAVDDHGRPADEEGYGDGGHEEVDSPTALFHRLVRTRRPESRRERER